MLSGDALRSFKIKGGFLVKYDHEDVNINNPKSTVWFKWKGLLEKKVTIFSIDVDDGRPVKVTTELDNEDGHTYIVTEIHSARIVNGKLRVTGKSHKVKQRSMFAKFKGLPQAIVTTEPHSPKGRKPKEEFT